MKKEEYKKIVDSVIEKDSILKNVMIAFFSGGLIGMIGEFLSNFIINKPFSAINTAARHIFSRYLLENKHLFYQYFKISNTGIDHLEQLINVNFFSSDRTSFCECNRFP